MKLNASLSRPLPNGKGMLTFSPHIRYGFHNTHLNPWAELRWRRRTFEQEGDDAFSSRQTWSLSGGKRVSQFNPDNPISEPVNALYTLWWRENYMKIYENYFTQLSSTTRFDNGMRLNIKGWYEDRIPIANTTDYSFVTIKGRSFTPNYPVEQLDTPFPRHQAVLTSIDLAISARAAFH